MTPKRAIVVLVLVAGILFIFLAPVVPIDDHRQLGHFGMANWGTVGSVSYRALCVGGVYFYSTVNGSNIGNYPTYGLRLSCSMF
ncbi:MAG TPA: hypothetical protein VGR56_08095 [Nitrososphaerales archaeon]|nr:hypothetical protein [Nitrososphaerales archaeon]